MVTQSVESRQLAAALCVSSLAFWFFLGFPWSHHNESLMWALGLEKASLADVFTSNPIGFVVGTYRPLGILVAWLTFHLTHGGLWLQQLLNFVVTAFAWLIAMSSARHRLAFALVAFVCGFVYFPGYIFLFHLHGVFYGPLFIFLALLLRFDRDAPLLTAFTCWRLFALAALTTLFHTFALLLFCGYVGGLWLQNLLARQRPGTVAALATICLAGAAMILMAASSSAFGGNSPWRGLLASYQTLETNTSVMLISAVLTVAAAASIGDSRSVRTGALILAAVLVAGLAIERLPVIWAWIAVCLGGSLMRRRLGLAGLIGSTALLPMATGTGSPTYALFVLMPCAVATAWEVPAAVARPLRPAAVAVLLGTAAAFVALLAGVPVPVLKDAAYSLRAERQKTQQMMNAFDWLDSHPGITGNLRLCQPGENPSQATDAIARRYRAPTHSWALALYAKTRYAGRLSQDSPLLMFCFGGQAMPGGTPVYSAPGSYAGSASIFSLPAPQRTAADARL
jgi:hypothetical protein